MGCTPELSSVRRNDRVKKPGRSPFSLGECRGALWVPHEESRRDGLVGGGGSLSRTRLRAPNSLLTGKNTGNSTVFPINNVNQVSESRTHSQFPTTSSPQVANWNREFISRYQGISSRLTANFAAGFFLLWIDRQWPRPVEAIVLWKR